MRLLPSIQIYIENTQNSAAKSDYKLLLRSLEAYLDGRDADVLRLAQPWFIDQYHAFLVDHYRSNKAKNTALTPEQTTSTALRYLKTLRKYVNHLIADGDFPDLDIFEGTGLAASFRRQRRKQPLPVRLELEPSTEPLIGPLIDARQRTAGWEIFLCGADPAELTAADFNDSARKIYLKSFNLWVEYPEELYSRLKSLKGIPAAHPFDLVHLLNLIIAKKLAADPRRIITLWLATNKKPTQADEQMLKRTVETLSQHFNPYHRNWYAIKTFGCTAQELAERILQPGNGLTDLLVGHPGDIYVPHTPPPVKRRRNRPRIIDRSAVLKHTLFVRVYGRDIAKLSMQLPGAYVYRSRGAGVKEFQVVPYSEIRTLQLVLHSMGAKQAALESSLDNYPVLKPGTIVEVNIPDFEGYKAEVKERNADGTYDLTLTAVCFQLTLSRIHPELINS